MCVCVCACSVFYKADYCSPEELMEKEGGGLAVLKGLKVAVFYV